MQAIISSARDYVPKLLKGFLNGKFHKYFQPVNMVKNYFGEKVAFEYAFLIHYEAWLFLPSVLGILLFFYQLDRFRISGEFKESLDSPLNGVYGIFIAIWATAFVESWQRKQKTIQYIWGCSDSSYSPLDERDNQFKFFFQFDDVTIKKTKIKQTMPSKLKYTYKILSYFFLGVVIFAMVLYQNVIITTKPQMDHLGEELVP